MNKQTRLECIVEAVKYCQRVQRLGMPTSAWSKALREPIHFLWERYQHDQKKSKHDCATHISDAATKLSRDQIIYDHAIPFRYCRDELCECAAVTPESVEKILRHYASIALISKEEDSLLNAHGYRQNMPKDWDGKNPFARYEAVGIKIQAVCSSGVRAFA